jgi:hypothetical protein
MVLQIARGVSFPLHSDASRFDDSRLILLHNAGFAQSAEHIHPIAEAPDCVLILECKINLSNAEHCGQDAETAA